MWYLSGLSPGDRGKVSRAGSCLVWISPPSETVPVVADGNSYMTFITAEEAVSSLTATFDLCCDQASL